MARGVMSVKFSVIWVQARNRHQFTLIPGATGQDLWEVHRCPPWESWEGKSGQIPRPGGAGCSWSWAEGREAALPLNRSAIVHCWPMAGSRFCGHPAARGAGKDATPEKGPGKGRRQVLASTVGGSYRNLAQTQLDDFPRIDQQTEGVGPLCSHTHTHTLPPPLQPGLEPPFLEEEPWEQQTEALRQGAT